MARDLARRSAWVLVALGLYLTLRGYHSRDGDQTYRLPLLLHRQDPRAFANDPFVRAFDAFNPHAGYLALLDGCSRPFGLSFALFVLFAGTFAITASSIDRLARMAWPSAGRGVGIAAVTMVLLAKAGNIGTNHLFEAMLLDRLMALALGWWAIAEAAGDPNRGRWTSALAIGAATLIHPSMGMQLASLLGAGWIAWALSRSVSIRTGLTGSALTFLCVLPGMSRVVQSSSSLMDGLSPEDFYTLSALVQSPQHMVPAPVADAPMAGVVLLLRLGRHGHLANPPPSQDGI